MIVVKNGSILKQTATFHCHFLMPKSNQKAFAKSKAIFNLIFLRKKIKTADKMNADASFQTLRSFYSYCCAFRKPNSFAIQNFAFFIFLF
jgi:hypothetical protein